jgi:hypothetical protein
VGGGGQALIWALWPGRAVVCPELMPRDVADDSSWGSRGRLVSALSVGSRIIAYKRFLVGWPNMACFFHFLLLPFSINFEIFSEIKSAQIWKFHFEILFRLKFVQFEICSISNFMFKFKKFVQI